MYDPCLIKKIIYRRQVYKYGGVEFYGLSKEDFIVFCCIHLYKEETDVYRILNDNDGYFITVVRFSMI